MSFPLFYANIVNNVNSKSTTINEDMVNILEHTETFILGMLSRMHVRSCGKNRTERG